MVEKLFISSLNDILEEYIKIPADDFSNEIKNIIGQFQAINKQLIASLQKKENQSRDKLFELAKAYQHQKLDQFKDIHAALANALIPLNLDEYRKEILVFTKKQPLRKKRLQSRNRFYPVKEDSRIIKILKLAKRFFFQITTIPKRTLNLVRRIFKRNTRKINFWNYAIPYRELTSYHVDHDLTIRILSLINEFARESVANLKYIIDQEQQLNQLIIDHTLKKQDKTLPINKLGLDLDLVISSQDKAYETFENELKELSDWCLSSIKDRSQVCGTMEYPVTLLKYQNRKNKKAILYKKLSQDNLGWGNTAFGLFEDWKIDQEIYNLSYFSKMKMDLLLEDYRENNRVILSHLKSSNAKITELNRKLQKQISDNPNDAADTIRSEIKLIHQSIDVKSLEKAIDELVSFNLPEGISSFESKVNGFLKEISEKRWLTKLTNYNKPLSNSELHSFSPRELISFEYLPRLTDACSSVKSHSVRQVDDLKDKIKNIENVVAFNLSSLAESIQRGECDSSEIGQLVDESLDRAKNKLEEIISILSEDETGITDNLNQIVNNFVNDSDKLTINENAFNLRIILMKAKALKRSEEVKEEFLRKLKKLHILAWQKTKLYLGRAEKILLPWKKRIGFDDSAGSIATELSDFLQEYKVKINSLPIIYQRLYKISPLTELNLFTGRQEELTILKNALESWKKNKYSPTVIIGEKWSGHTTLINYFTKNFLGNRDIIYLDRNINIENQQEFLFHWKDVLEEKNLGSVEDIISTLKQKHNGKVIVMENLQNYYLRVINGFDTLKSLIQLISETSKDIFWICSSNIYAWKYLNNTINLAGYFGYVVEMKPFSDSELRELIMKKNNISGYKIVFSPSQRNLASKKFLRLSEEERQFYLRDRFFNDLNKYAIGNISLALTFWLLSTTNITEESIEIINFTPPDFSFINKLDADKVFIMYLLIMHDGLNFEQLNKVYPKTKDRLQLMIIMLLDDGILFERNDRYEVNPLIYRHAIDMLKSRNLIY